MKGNATRGNKVSFGEYALQSLEPGRINGRQIEAEGMARSHHLAREGRVYIRIFPHKSFSKKPLETRMAPAREPDHWAAEVKPGTILFEIAGVDETVARRKRVAYRCRCGTPLRASPSHAVSERSRKSEVRTKVRKTIMATETLKEYRRYTDRKFRCHEEELRMELFASAIRRPPPKRSRTPTRPVRSKKTCADQNDPPPAGT